MNHDCYDHDGCEGDCDCHDHDRDESYSPKAGDKAAEKISALVTACEDDEYCFQIMANAPFGSADWMIGKSEANYFVEMAERVKKMFKVKE